MSYPMLYRVAAVLLTLGTMGHTFGGMIGTAVRGPQAGEAADDVMIAMKSTHFTWRGADSTWYAWWLGNGLSVTALLVLAVTALWFLGGLEPSQRRLALPLAWAASVSLTGLSVLSFLYFANPIGAVFGLIALLTTAATVITALGPVVATATSAG